MPCMSETVKVVLALLFVTVLGWVLLQPVFDAVDEDAVDASRAPSSTPTAERMSPAPSAHDDDEEDAVPAGAFRTRRLSANYPPGCLRATPLVSDVVAVDRGDAIAVGSLGGSLSEFDGTRLFGVGVGGGAAWRDGERGSYVGVGGSRQIKALPAVRLVLWSPIADCAVAVTTGGALLALPSELPLLEDNVGGVAFSPDGGELAVVLKEEDATSVWIASLGEGEMREVMRDRRSLAIELQGWSTNGRTLYMTWPDGGLSFVTTSDPPQSGGISVRPAEVLEGCGRRLLGIIDDRIVEISRRGPDYLTRTRESYRYLACSPDGGFIAAIGSDGLVLLDPDGRALRDLTEDTGYTDVFVDWGQGGAGVIFGRVRDDPDAAELWHLPEGGSARPTGISYRGAPAAVDWAASPPSGVP